MADDLVYCEESTCGEATHPRSDGAKRCPKHYPEAKKSQKKDPKER